MFLFSSPIFEIKSLCTTLSSLFLSSGFVISLFCDFYALLDVRFVRADALKSLIELFFIEMWRFWRFSRKTEFDEFL